MVDYYVVSKSEGWREYCTGPVTAQAKLEQLVRVGKKFEDLKIEIVPEKKPRTRARAESGRKRSTKLRYK